MEYDYLCNNCKYGKCVLWIFGAYIKCNHPFVSRDERHREEYSPACNLWEMREDDIKPEPLGMCV